MPDTSFTGIQVPAGTDGYSFEQQLGDLADSVRVVIPAANATAAAQVASEATAAGFPATASSPLYVHRLDLGAILAYDGSAWSRLTGRANGTPYATAAGVRSYDMAGGTSQTYAISFPSGRFTTTPIVIPGSTQHALLVATAEGVSVSGFTLRLTMSNSTSSTYTGTVGWQALQMTDTAAAG